jgi:hypothetical protein
VSLVPSDGGSGPGATYYTLDGSDPTTSSSRVLYTAPFLLSASATVQFYTLDKVGNAEAVESQAVTISSGGGVAFVQQKSLGSSGSTASLQVPLTSASVSGDTLVAVVALAAGSSASVTGVTDSAGGTWTPGPIGYLSGANSRVEIWYRLGGPSATTVTVGISPAKAVAVNVSEWSGVATTSALDLSKNGSGASATTIATATPFTTGNATDLLIGAANYPATATPTLTSSGWSGLNPFTSGTGVHGIAAYQITTAAGGYQASWSLTAPSGGHGTAILALKGSSGGGGAAPPAPTLTLTPADGRSFVTGSTVYYNSGTSSSFSVGASASGATAMTFPNVFSGSDGATDSSEPFSQSYSWTSGASTSGSVSVTASNSSGPSPASQFTVTPDGTAPSTTTLCNGSSCSGSYSSPSPVTVDLVRNDGGSGVQTTYYTTDGTTPTTSSAQYSTSLSISTTSTVKFFSVDRVGNAESVQTLVVTIGGGGGGVAFVQQKSLGSSGSTASLQVPLTSASVSGNTLVAVVALAAGSSANVSGVTDSSGTPWTAAPVIGYLSGVNSRVEIWYRTGAPSVSSVTVNLSASKAVAVNVSEWSGVATTSALDLSKNGSGASAPTISTATPFTTGNATDLVIGAANYPATATPTLTSSGWSGLNPFTSGTGVHGIAAYQITTAAGGYQASWSLNASSGGHGTAIVALKGA